MKTFSLLFATVLLFAGLPEASAQSADWWEWAARSDRDDDRYDRRGDWDDDDRWDDDEWEDRRDRRSDRRDRRYDRRNDRRERGPKFCRNGQGHPTKGMRWCYEKGYASRNYERRSDRRNRRAGRWERRSVEDVIFRTPRRDRRADRRSSRRVVLEDILGRRRYRQLQRVADGPVAARWVYPSRTTRVLQVRDRRGPLFEMTDLNGDGRVDVFLANSQR